MAMMGGRSSQWTLGAPIDYSAAFGGAKKRHLEQFLLDYAAEKAGARSRGELKASTSTASERLGDYVSEGLRKAGVSDRRAEKLGGKLATVLETITPVGDATGGIQAGRDLRQGDWLAGGLGALATVLPGAAKRMFGGRGIRAWHGSPHDFDKFDNAFIGTGEGAQSYGYGHYVAEARPVGENYREVLSQNRPVLGGAGVRNATLGDTDEVRAALQRHFQGRDMSIPDAARRYTYQSDANDLILEAIDEAGNDYGGALQYLSNKAATEPDRLFSTYVPRDDANAVGQAYAKAHALLSENPFTQTRGHLYEVNINARPDEFLDWDAPGDKGALLAQADLERAAAMRSAMGISNAGFRPADLQTIINHLGPQLPEVGLSLGIPGIRYLDQGSRGAGQGTRNYVVFDPDIIEILNKY